ncbi:MAG: rRNA maturation RNase YbeY [Candidatus Eisenbacteria bacterium]|nr:rRNA maturation RNase YbeY [Candidatus Eisenbacteria bacterium]
MPISVAAETDGGAPSPARSLAVPVRALVSLVLKRLGRRTGEVAVVLAGDALTRRLNREWRRMDHATDVITFAYDEHEADADTRPINGDLVVSMDRVRVQAKRWRVTEAAELARLVIHGALHLCGHDHMRAAERRVMRAFEDAAMLEAEPVIAAMEKKWPKAAKPTKPAAAPKAGPKPARRPRPAIAKSRRKRRD